MGTGVKALKRRTCVAERRNQSESTKEWPDNRSVSTTRWRCRVWVGNNSCLRIRHLHSCLLLKPVLPQLCLWCTCLRIRHLRSRSLYMTRCEFVGLVRRIRMRMIKCVQRSDHVRSASGRTGNWKVESNG